MTNRYILSTHYIYAFLVISTSNTDLFCTPHQFIGLCNANRLCSFCGANRMCAHYYYNLQTPRVQEQTAVTTLLNYAIFRAYRRIRRLCKALIFFKKNSIRNPPFCVHRPPFCVHNPTSSARNWSPSSVFTHFLFFRTSRLCSLHHEMLVTLKQTFLSSVIDAIFEDNIRLFDIHQIQIFILHTQHDEFDVSCRPSFVCHFFFFQIT